MERHRNGVPVSDGTWPQLMSCAPSRLWCPNFGRVGVQAKGVGVGRY